MNKFLLLLSMCSPNNLKIRNIEIKDITDRTISVIGGKGSGKSTTIKIIAKSIKETDEKLPVYIFDPLSKIKIKGYDILKIKKEDDENKENIDPKNSKSELGLRNNRPYNIENVLPRRSTNLFTNGLRIIKRT